MQEACGKRGIFSQPSIEDSGFSFSCSNIAIVARSGPAQLLLPSMQLPWCSLDSFAFEPASHHILRFVTFAYMCL